MIIEGGKANPAPPIGPALGQAKVAIGEFVTRFNEATKDRRGEPVPIVINVYEDRTFDFILKQPPASALLLKAAGKEKGSAKSGVEKAATVTRTQVREIAEKKLPDLNAADMEGAVKIIEGTARSMGIEVK